MKSSISVTIYFTMRILFKTKSIIVAFIIIFCAFLLFHIFAYCINCNGVDCHFSTVRAHSRCKMLQNTMILVSPRINRSANRLLKPLSSAPFFAVSATLPLQPATTKNSPNVSRTGFPRLGGPPLNFPILTNVIFLERDSGITAPKTTINKTNKTYSRLGGASHPGGRSNFWPGHPGELPRASMENIHLPNRESWNDREVCWRRAQRDIAAPRRANGVLPGDRELWVRLYNRNRAISL